jgi:hypothetical protein
LPLLPIAWAQLRVKKKKNICTPAHKAITGILKKGCLPMCAPGSGRQSQGKQPSYLEILSRRDWRCNIY